MLKAQSAKIIQNPEGLATVSAPDFFSFDGVNVGLRVQGDEVIKLFREGKLITLLKGKIGETLNLNGKVLVGDIFIVGSEAFFAAFSEEKLNFLKPSLIPPDLSREGAKMVSFFEVAKKSPLDFVRKFIPERRIIVRQEVGSEENSKGRKTTLSVGIILLAILIVSVVFGIRQKSTKQKEAETTKQEQDARAKEAAGFYNANPELFLDLTLLSSGFKGEAVSVSAGKIYILDKNSKKIVGVEIANKKSEVIAGQGKLNEAFDLASYENRVFVSDSEGVKEVGGDISTAIKKDWEGDALIHSFAGNLYVLDKNANAIYRYSGSETGFGSKQNWLSASTKPDFSDAKSWAFDGAIYVLVGNRVLKYSQGSPQAFSIAPEVLSLTAFYADEENKYLYVLDKENGKVFVLEKDGKFKAQYSSDQIKNAVNLIASETEKKMILLTGEKLLSIEMRDF